MQPAADTAAMIMAIAGMGTDAPILPIALQRRFLVGCCRKLTNGIGEYA